MKPQILKNIIFRIRILRARSASRSLFAPSDNFSAEAKSLFLSEFDRKFPVTNIACERSIFRKHRLGFALCGVAAILIASGSSMVLADQVSVTPGNPLYAIKRTKEAIQVSIAPTESTPEVHYQLAQKRLDEIKKIDAGNQKDSDKEKDIKSLRKDFSDQIDSSVQKLDSLRSSSSDYKEKKQKLCESISKSIKDEKGIAPKYKIDQEDYSRFESSCKDSTQNNPTAKESFPDN